MIVLIICIILIIIGKIISKSDWCYDNDFDIIGFVIIGISTVVLIINTIAIITTPYSYDNWIVERNSFVTTLNDSRENGRELESAAIVQQISIWNQELASAKYWNNTLWSDWYYDDRVEDLDYIK